MLKMSTLVFAGAAAAVALGFARGSSSFFERASSEFTVPPNSVVRLNPLIVS